MNIAFFGDSLTEGFPGSSYFKKLQNKLPYHSLHNFGRGGDTVISLLRRLRKTSCRESFDIGFLWVGVNDAFVDISWTYPILKRMRGQRWAGNLEAFRQHYLALIDFLSARTKHLFTVSPLFIGEDLGNPWNTELGRQAQIIKKLAQDRNNTEYVDLRKKFLPLVQNLTVSPFIPKSALRILWDVLKSKGGKAKRGKKSPQGLHFTIDGVHLNEKGAEIVADVFFKAMNKHLA
jgi:lysophospholipase L1-like esterase